MDLAGRIRYLCEAAGGSRENLSERAGLTGSHLGLLVSGQIKEPKGSTASTIARFFGCSLSWLLDGEGECPSPDAVRAAVERARQGAA